MSCATDLASPGTYPSSASWSITCGTNNTGSDPKGLFWGVNSSGKAKMILSNGDVSGASGIATALGVATSDTYYSALICSTAFANITKVEFEATATGGTAPDYVWLLKSTNSGTTWSVVERKAYAASLTYTIASPSASATYAFVIHCSNWGNVRIPVITFHTTD